MKEILRKNLGIIISKLDSQNKDVIDVYAFDILDSLLEQKTIQKDVSDENVKTAFVAVQAAYEASLLQMHKDGAVSDIKYYIHTPISPSPLMTKDNEIMLKVYNDSVSSQRMSLVNIRKAIIHSMLKCGIHLVCCYSQTTTFQKLTDNVNGADFAEMLDIYKNHLKSYNNLVDMPFDGSVTTEFSGATCTFKFHGETYVFDINAYQVTSKEQSNNYSISFGLGKDKEISEGRVGNIINPWLQDKFKVELLPSQNNQKLGFRAAEDHKELSKKSEQRQV